MNGKIKNILCAVCFAAFTLCVGVACLFGNKVDILVSERRKAAEFPKFSAETIADKSFFDGLEKYLMDQFPSRDSFRALKAGIEFKLLLQKDNSGIYTVQGHISELDDKLSESSVIRAAEKFNAINEEYLKPAGTTVYYSVIPDKNYYLAPENGYPAMDYERLRELFTSEMSEMQYINIFDCLDADSYYRTDTHWRQEKLGKVVNRLGEAMGFSPLPIDGYHRSSPIDFSGVYAPRLALSAKADEIILLNSSATDSASVYNLETDKTSIGVYDESKLSGYDKYDVFLSGATPLLTVENPLAEQKRELIIFRDSFGSSLAPLLLENYSKITLVDLRYMSSMLLGDYVNFDGCDVLFLFNTRALNQSNMFK